MADLRTNLKVIQNISSALDKALDQEARYFDAGDYVEYFTRFNAAIKELCALDSSYEAVPVRTPILSSTDGFEGRGSLSRNVLERLHEDTILTLDIAKSPSREENLAVDRRKIFVVHGRNQKAADAMFDFLRSLDLDPIEWSEAIKMTGKGSPYVGEVLDIAFAKAQAVIVLFTGDDNAIIDTRLLSTKEKAEPKRRQPRPNVLFEAGMALGRQPERTIIVEVGPVSTFSDIHGRHTVRMDDSAEMRVDLANRLHTAGCTTKIEGRKNWLKAGNFDAAILPIEDTTPTARPTKKSIISDRSPDTVTSPSDSSLPPEAIEILKVLATLNGRRTSAGEVAGGLRTNEQRVQYFLDLLRDRDFAARTGYMGRPATYTLSTNGRKYLFDNGLL